MKYICKVCGEKINIIVFGSPKDICWGCLSKDKHDEVININAKNVKHKN